MSYVETRFQWEYKYVVAETLYTTRQKKVHNTCVKIEGCFSVVLNHYLRHLIIELLSFVATNNITEVDVLPTK